uniref:Uncharacterized protein n=1 Tax=Anguilla anguilla TaxID=7936 RepID=A0A0E9TQY2_ANGAN
MTKKPYFRCVFPAACQKPKPSSKIPMPRSSKMSSLQTDRN